MDWMIYEVKGYQSGPKTVSHRVLSGWTLKSAIQPHVEVYVSQATFEEVKRSFPYLVSEEYATGGGDASFKSSSLGSL